MATSTCPKCSNTAFEAVRVTMVSAPDSYTFIQCAKCGCVVGVSDTTSISNAVDAIRQAIHKQHHRA